MPGYVQELLGNWQSYRNGVISIMRKNIDTKLIVRYAVRETMGIVVMGVALFWSAGQIDWWPAWASLAVMSAWIMATAIVILRSNPDLIAERLGHAKAPNLGTLPL